MPKPLAEQVVVITGASSGIGRAAALYLAARGARLVLTARRAEALRELAEQIRDNGGEAIAVPGDVTREEDLAAVARAAVERWGRIDSWVNNAAVYIQGRVWDIGLDEYRRIWETNLVGYTNGTQQALTVMLEQNSGTIIQVSSILAKRGAAYFSAYAASKAGIDGLVGSLRAELWGTGIRVCTLYLPPVDTPIYRHSRGKLGTIPKPPPPVSTPEQVAKVIAELAEHPRNVRILGPFGHLYLLISRLPSRFGDWFLHHTAGFTLSDIPDTGDNLDAPMHDTPRLRDGWAEVGWRGLTLRGVARALPWESLAGAVAAGFLAGRISRKG